MLTCKIFKESEHTEKKDFEEAITNWMNEESYDIPQTMQSIDTEGKLVITVITA